MLTEQLNKCFEPLPKLRARLAPRNWLKPPLPNVNYQPLQDGTARLLWFLLLLVHDVKLVPSLPFVCSDNIYFGLGLLNDLLES